MRKAILTTAAIGLIAVGAALGVTQGDNIKSWLTSSAELYNTRNTEVSENAATPSSEDVASATTSQEVVPDTAPSSAVSETAKIETEGATPVDLDLAPAAGEEAKDAAADPSAPTPVTEEAKTDAPAAEAAAAPAADETVTPAPEATPPAAAEAAPATKYKFNLGEALRDREQGSANAPVVVEDFSSLTCPHCAKFHNEIFDKIKQNYIDTGKVRWIYRSYPLNEAALRAEMLARCAPNDQYIALTDMMFKNQIRWAYSDDPLANLSIMVRIAGITDDIFLTCVNDKELQAALVKSSQDYANKYSIKATPTFVFNGGEKNFSGAGTYDGFAADIESLLRNAKETKQTEIPADKLESAKP